MNKAWNYPQIKSNWKTPKWECEIWESPEWEFGVSPKVRNMWESFSDDQKLALAQNFKEILNMHQDEWQ